MRCEEVQDVLIDARGGADPSARRAAMDHLSQCDSCRDAQSAVAALHGARLERIPPPSPGARERAVAAAFRAHAGHGETAAAERRKRVPAPGTRSVRPGFWTGMTLGGALAAALAVALVWSLPRQSPPAASAAMPEVTMALNETRDISIAVDSRTALADAEIHVELTGALGLAGFADQRELRWRTNLDAGSNKLTLPVVALGSRGGQVLVEVLHGDKRRTFVVDVRAIAADRRTSGGRA